MFAVPKSLKSNKYKLKKADERVRNPILSVEI